MTSLRDHLKGHDSTRRDTRGPSNKKIAFLAIALVVLFAIGMALYIKGKSAYVPTDPDTLCPTNRPPSEVTVLILDMSDAYSEAQKLQIRNELERAKGKLKQFALFEAYAVDRLGERVPKPVLCLCNPGTERDVNLVYQNPKKAKKRWEEFVSRLDTELSRLMKTEDSNTSPIFEAIQSAAIRTLNLPKYDHVPKRLILVSDLLQNVPGKLSHYREKPKFVVFKQSAYFSEVRADLTNIKVKLLYLIRPGTVQNVEHRLFWEQYFAAQGATVDEVVPIYGAR